VVGSRASEVIIQRRQAVTAGKVRDGTVVSGQTVLASAFACIRITNTVGIRAVVETQSG
jgi:hypothetical protein